MARRSKRAIAIDKSKKAKVKTKKGIPANRSDKDRRKRI
jgi:hypothetical protein